MIKKKKTIPLFERVWTLKQHHFEKEHILAIFIYPPLSTEEKMQIEEEKIYRGNGSIRACLRGKVKRYPDVEVSPPQPLGGERCVTTPA